MRKILVTAALVAAVVAVGQGCKRVNGAYCDDARPCGAGSSCDLVARECRPSTIGGGGDLGGGGGGGGGTGCGACGGTTPLCAGGGCIACTSTSDGDGACSALSSTTPHCASDGACVGCRNAADCGGTTPFCDATTRQCRGCVADNECPSLICDLTPGSTTHGQCVDPSKVAYADINGPNGNGLTITTAKAKIMDAINVAVGLNPPRPYVHIAAGTYDEGVGVMSGSIYLVGAPGAIIHPTGGGKDAVGAQNNGVMTVRNIIATANAGNAANCATNGTLNAYRSQFINASQTGVYASTTCTLLLDSCWVHGNAQGGVTVGNKFTIINSIITKNAGGGVNQIGTAATQIFVNNTVADNTSGILDVGVNCMATGAFEVKNSILYNNKSGGTTISETNCPSSFDASDDPSAGPQSTVDLTAQSPGFKATVPLSPDSYHLLPTSKCINEGTASGVPDHDFDFEPRPDPTSMKVDIGADEVQ